MAEPAEPDRLLPDYPQQVRAELREPVLRYAQQDAEPVLQADFWERTSRYRLLPERQE
ncbi:hypothetical protein AA18895_1897 [Acetobacter ghanensis DSM 18895]|nr:hypothetical protein AA18895_1897 [Acetobacter ghanensis DSM 18895]